MKKTEINWASEEVEEEEFVVGQRVSTTSWIVAGALMTGTIVSITPGCFTGKMIVSVVFDNGDRGTLYSSTLKAG